MWRNVKKLLCDKSVKCTFVTKLLEDVCGYLMNGRFITMYVKDASRTIFDWMSLWLFIICGRLIDYLSLTGCLCRYLLFLMPLWLSMLKGKLLQLFSKKYALVAQSEE